MTYLSATNSPLVNLNLIQQGIVLTKEYSDALDERNQKEFEPKIRALKITTIALAILSPLFAAVISLPAGLLVGTAAILTGIVLIYQKDKQQFHQSKIDATIHTVDVVFTNIIIFLCEQVSKKEDISINAYKPRLAPSECPQLDPERQRSDLYLLRTRNAGEKEIKAYEEKTQVQTEEHQKNERVREDKAGSKICTLNDAVKDLREIDASFNNGELKKFEEKDSEFITSYLKLIPLAKVIVNLHVPLAFKESALWVNLTHSCKEVLEGRGKVNRTFRRQHENEIIGPMPFVKIQKVDGQWKAVKW